MLYGRMVQLGAQTFYERGEGNEQHPEGHAAGFRAWFVNLRQRILDAFPLSNGEQPVAEDAFIEPKWKLKLAPSRSVTENGNHTLTDGRITHIDKPSPVPLPVKGAFAAEILRNERVTAPSHFQDVRLLDLRIDKHYTYGPGAIAVVYPKNFPEDVQSFIDLMHWQAVANTTLTVHATTSNELHPPHPLRHLDLSRLDTPLTLRWLLENVLDIMSIPRRSFFASLARLLTSNDSTQPPLTEDQLHQKDRLLELANPELIDELWDYTTRPKRTILEVMMDFTQVQVPWQYALSTLPIMRGRQFSIASGGSQTRDETGRTKAELLIAIADPPSPIIKYRRRYGVCTRYISSLVAGQRLNVGLQQGYLNVQPNELEVPVLMIGPGTGVAPMRSLIHQRLAWQQQSICSLSSRQRLKGDILIFGCRGSEADFFFRDEWSALAEQEGLTVWTAFSRDRKERRQYVQDVIRAHAAEVCETLLEKGGKVYVCGSSGNMPKGVREALIDVLVGKTGVSGARHQAEAYLDRMEKEGRYKQETW